MRCWIASSSCSLTDSTLLLIVILPVRSMTLTPDTQGHDPA